MAAADSLRTPLRRATFATLIGLLAVTGIRVGEAIGLNRGDLDLPAGLLLVRHGKFDKTRELALHPTTVDALRRYQRLRDRTRPSHRARRCSISTAGTRLLYCNVHHTFHRLVHAAGLTPRSASCRPRIHDLRHSFAVRRDARRLRRRPGRAGPADAAVDLARSRPPGQHLLVPVGVPGADGPGRAAARSSTWHGRP